MFRYSAFAPWRANGPAIACDAVTSIFDWLGYFLLLGLFGLAVVGFGSLGNFSRAPMWKPLTGALAVLVTVIVPFMMRNREAQDSDDRYLRVVSLILGVLCAAFHLSHFSTILIEKCRLDESPPFKLYLTASSILNSTQIKWAGGYKMAIHSWNT